MPHGLLAYLLQLLYPSLRICSETRCEKSHSSKRVVRNMERALAASPLFGLCSASVRIPDYTDEPALAYRKPTEPRLT
jgi:hypothetical protein